VNDRSVFFEAAPVTFVGEGFTARDAHRSEDAPAADNSRLAGREADFLDRLQTVVMENVVMDHADRPLRSGLDDATNRLYLSFSEVLAG
jgi:hypothetical protein